MLRIPGNINTRFLIIGAYLLALILFVATCDSIQSESKLSGVAHPSGEEFAGSATCIKCHQSIHDSHLQTPHFLTSGLGNSETVLGSFDSGKNVFVLNEKLKIAMEKNASGLFQKAMVDDVEVDRKPMEITLGSGRQGQTYLFWKDNVLFQLPASYHAPSDTWSNSPGYPTDQIVFNRSVTARCLECHSTYFKIGRVTVDGESFDREQVMLGVDCERCHGPAGRHVTFHEEHPDASESKYVINPAQLTRKQRLDNCALCHSGIRDNFLPSFSFSTGDNLDEFLFPPRAASGGTTLDVHGNQYGLLASSKCFQMSEMDCSSCHDVHAKETRKLEVFSARCMNCHKRETNNFCTQPEVPGLVLSKNCIDCHMPALPSKQVFLRASDNTESTPFFIRTHHVGNYDKQVILFLEKLNTRSEEKR